MSKMNVELCPETGICSLIRPDGNKVDLMPEEVDAVRAAAGDANAIRQALSAIDPGFAERLAAEEIAQIAGRLH